MTGDNVILEGEEDAPMIAQIKDRENELFRPAIANITQVFIVSAVLDPLPDFVLIDKLIINVRYRKLKPILIFNKLDLAKTEDVDKIKKYYRNTGIPLYFLSANEDKNLNVFNSTLKNEISIFTGQSGVGKTSLLNKILNLKEKTGEISQKSKKGRHTTRQVELFKIFENGFLADTPGFNITEINSTVSKNNLKDYYDEYRDLSNECFFNNCIHLNEPKCRVKEAILSEILSLERYENYKLLYNELKDKENRF